MPRYGSQTGSHFRRDWLAILEANCFHSRLLDEDHSKRWHRDIQTFVAKKHWEGCSGFEITDEVKVTIAAQACLMLLGRENNCFRRVRTILVYPSGFFMTDGEGSGMPAAGVAHPDGPVAVAWDNVFVEARDPTHGRNVVIHEFAHQLDFAGEQIGAAFEFLGNQSAHWQRIFNEEYHRHSRLAMHGRSTLLGEYAATNKREFFATLCECYFMQPANLDRYHPELLELLQEYFALDVRPWFGRITESS